MQGAGWVSFLETFLFRDDDSFQLRSLVGDAWKSSTTSPPASTTDRHARRGIEWLRPYEGTSEDYGYAEFYASVEAVLLGRATYEKLPGVPGVALRRKPYWFCPANGNTPASVVAEMKARGLRRAWLVGGGKLAAAFRAEGLITEHIVSVVPVILGAGTPLFDGAGTGAALRSQARAPIRVASSSCAMNNIF